MNELVDVLEEAVKCVKWWRRNWAESLGSFSAELL